MGDEKKLFYMKFPDTSQEWFKNIKDIIREAKMKKGYEILDFCHDESSGEIGESNKVAVLLKTNEAMEETFSLALFNCNSISAPDRDIGVYVNFTEESISQLNLTAYSTGLRN
jgi:hypothetical protein